MLVAVDVGCGVASVTSWTRRAPSMDQCTPSISLLIHDDSAKTTTPAITATAPMSPKYANSQAGS
jgi:hypothetical protein